MKITLDLPEFDLGHDADVNDPYYNPGLCAGCGYERWGQMVRLHGTGWLHAENEDGETNCLQKAIDALAAPDMTTAWTTVALHVAKYPSRHDASTIRSVIRQLVQLAQRPDA